MMYRIIVLHNDGTMQHETAEAPDYFALGRQVRDSEIKSFIVTLA